MFTSKTHDATELVQVHFETLQQLVLVSTDNCFARTGIIDHTTRSSRTRSRVDIAME
jgi:hypothetical protein